MSFRKAFTAAAMAVGLMAATSASATLLVDGANTLSIIDDGVQFDITNCAATNYSCTNIDVVALAGSTAGIDITPSGYSVVEGGGVFNMSIVLEFTATSLTATMISKVSGEMMSTAFGDDVNGSSNASVHELVQNPVGPTTVGSFSLTNNPALNTLVESGEASFGGLNSVNVTKRININVDKGKGAQISNITQAINEVPEPAIGAMMLAPLAVIAFNRRHAIAALLSRG